MTSFCLRAWSAPAAALVLGVLVNAPAPAHADTQYTISPDGQEVLDTKTNLTWRRCAEGLTWDGKACTGKPVKYKLGDAKTLVATLDQQTGKAWRIPNKDELVGLVEKGKPKPKIDEDAFPNTPPAPFWSLRPGFTDNLNAFLVSFRDGKVLGNSGEKKFYVRLVRSN